MAVEHEPESETQAEAQGVGPWTGHAGIDRRVLEMTRVIVEKIDRDRALVRVGLENIERWTQQKGGYLPQCHAEWKELVESHPWERLREILLEESDEGQRLRSSHPFTGILTEDERDAIYARHGIDIPRMRRAGTRRAPAGRGRPPPRCWSNSGRRTGGPKKEQNKTRTPTEVAARHARTRSPRLPAGRKSLSHVSRQYVGIDHFHRQTVPVKFRNRWKGPQPLQLLPRRERRNERICNVVPGDVLASECAGNLGDLVWNRRVEAAQQRDTFTEPLLRLLPSAHGCFASERPEAHLRMNLANECASFRTPSHQGIDLPNLRHDGERLPRNSLAGGGSTRAIGVLERVDPEDCASGRRKDAGASTPEPAPRIPITCSTLSAFG